MEITFCKLDTGPGRNPVDKILGLRQLPVWRFTAKRWLHPALRKRAESLSSQYDDLSERMANAYSADLAIKLGRMEAVVDRFREFKATEDELPELVAMTRDAQLGADAQEELAAAKQKLEVLDKQLQTDLVPTSPFDDKACMIEIRPGIGGSEATLFTADMMRMYQNYCVRQGWQCTTLNITETPEGGVTEAILHITEPGSYARMQHEGGVHRVQRVPATETKGRVHTSTTGVIVLPDMGEEEASTEMEFSPRELRIDVMRASGAGGQHVNRTESAVRLVHIPTGTTVVCQDERSQHKNKAKALRVLRGRLADAQERQKRAEGRSARSAQVTSTDRSERIRTYNYPQNRVTDHRAGFSSMNLTEVMAGEAELDNLLDAVGNWSRAESLAALAAES